MSKTFLERVKDFADSITLDRKKNETIILLASREFAHCTIEGSEQDLATLLYTVASNDPAFARMLELVVCKLKEQK